MNDLAVGIDLGTTNSVVAVVKDQKAHVIPDREGRRVHPSVVSFHPKGTVLVGHDAVRRKILDPQNTFYDVKRLIGRPFRSEVVQKAMARVPYAVAEGPDLQPVVESRDNEFTIPEISAFVLRRLRSLAEDYLGQEVTRAVITVPANFSQPQRAATRAAGVAAGLEVLRILREPIAAALAYGYRQEGQLKLAVYDFGGGTFDITLLQLSGQVFEVLGNVGDLFLGGDDIDARLVQEMGELFLRQTRIDLRGETTTMARMLQAAEQVKRQLSARTQTLVQVEDVAKGPGGQPLNLSFGLTREQLDTLAHELVHRTFRICNEALSLCKLRAWNVDEVILVGGTTHLPKVRNDVAKFFAKPVRLEISPDEVVAVGAAVQAAALSRARDEVPQGVTSLASPPAREKGIKRIFSAIRSLGASEEEKDR